MTTTHYEEILERDNVFIAIHPLDDAPEQKVDVSGLGPMKMTRAARWSLIALRAYLFGMAVLVTYHVIAIAASLRK
jgi:hypothetical protein